MVRHTSAKSSPCNHKSGKVLQNLALTNLANAQLRFPWNVDETWPQVVYKVPSSPMEIEFYMVYDGTCNYLTRSISNIEAEISLISSEGIKFTVNT